MKKIKPAEDVFQAYIGAGFIKINPHGGKRARLRLGDNIPVIEDLHLLQVMTGCPCCGETLLSFKEIGGLYPLEAVDIYDDTP